MHKRESQNDEKCIINEGKNFNVVENEKKDKNKIVLAGYMREGGKKICLMLVVKYNIWAI